MSVTGFNRRRRELAKEIEYKEANKIDYSKMKVEELKSIAEKLGIENYLDMKKAELVESIEKLG